MDTLSHGLWGGLSFGHGRRQFWWALLLGMGPDLVSFGPYFLSWLVSGMPPYATQPGLGSAPSLSTLPDSVFVYYNVSHSLIVWALAFLLLAVLLQKFFWPLAAWGLHILCDIPTHTTAYFPTPFLWPFSTPYVNGFAWSLPWFICLNYLLLIGLGLFLAYKKNNQKKRPIIALIILATFVAGSWLGDKMLSRNGNPLTQYRQVNQPLPQFSLINQWGQRVSNKQLIGGVRFLTFAFAHCPSICPLIVQNVQQATQQLPEITPQIVIITLDPWRDTPDQLDQQAEKWQLTNKDYFLSGSVEEVQQTLAAFNMPTEKDERTGEISHPGLVHVINPEGLIVFTFNNPTQAMLIDAAKRAQSSY